MRFRVLLRHLQVRLENYPDLKANQNLLQIQTTLVMWKSKFLQQDVLIIQQLKSIVM